MKWYSIDQCFQFVRNGKNIKQYGSEGYPITRIETISDRIVDESKVGYACIYDIDLYKDYILRKGDILMSHINSAKHLGKVALFDSDSILIHGMNLLCLRAKTEFILAKYALYIFNSPIFLNQIPKITKNSVNQSSFNITSLKKLKIPVPPLEIQKQIVEVLDKAQNIIDKRREQINLFDELIKSIFYDMFGDIAKNDKCWKIKSWNEIFNTKTGKLNSNAMVEGGKYPFFTCSKEVYRINSYSYDCEALLLAGNNAAANYDVKYYKGKFDVYQRTYILTLKEKNNYFYFKHVLENKLLEMKVISNGTNTKYLTMTLLNKFNLPVPPLELQNKFAEIVEQIEKKKQMLTESLELMEENYNSIMQRAFKGEIFR